VATHPAVTEAQRQHLTTPDARGFRGVAELFGVSHQVVTPADLGPAVEVALTTAGATLLEVPVAPHGTATWVKRIRAALQP